jgi:hypothetical protein
MNRDTNNAEWQQQKPDEWIQNERQQSKRPGNNK